MLAYTYNVIIDRGVEEPGHGREGYQYFKRYRKRLISMLETTSKLPGVATYDKNI